MSPEEVKARAVAYEAKNDTDMAYLLYLEARDKSGDNDFCRDDLDRVYPIVLLNNQEFMRRIREK